MVEWVHHQRVLLNQLLAQLYESSTEPDGVRTQLRQWVESPTVQIGFALVGGTLVWVLYFTSVYGLTSLACQWGWLAAPRGGNGLKVLQGVITLVAAGLIGGGVYLAYTIWQQTRLSARDTVLSAANAHIPFLALLTVGLNGLYLLVLVLSLTSILLLPICR